MIHTVLPPESEMYDALCARDAAYEGIFFVGVKTTGIACRPTCPAKKPKRENVVFFPRVNDALSAGFRPCKRCRPLEPSGGSPEWLRPLLDEVERDPTQRISEAELAARGYEPRRVRRWFRAEHGMTFQGYLRARRLGKALGALGAGADALDVAYASGWESDSGFREAFGRLFGTTPTRARVEDMVRIKRLLTPLGPMLAGEHGGALVLLEFCDRRMLETQVKVLTRRLKCVFAPGESDLLDQAEAELAEYFDGSRTRFDVNWSAPGSPFQESVWEHLFAVPYGETTTYAELARSAGRPGAARAIGRANGDNRLAIVLPCHRVVGADGQLTGYGGGLWRKEALLEHERAVRARFRPTL